MVSRRSSITPSCISVYQYSVSSHRRTTGGRKKARARQKICNHEVGPRRNFNNNGIWNSSPKLCNTLDLHARNEYTSPARHILRSVCTPLRDRLMQREPINPIRGAHNKRKSKKKPPSHRRSPSSASPGHRPSTR